MESQNSDKITAKSIGAKIDPEARNKLFEYQQNFYEVLFEGILQNLKTNSTIDGYRRTKRHSPEDQQGIDFVINYHGFNIPIQTKAGRPAQRRDREKYYNIQQEGIIGINLLTNKRNLRDEEAVMEELLAKMDEKVKQLENQSPTHESK